MTDHRTDDASTRPHQAHQAGHRGHGWMMIACCIPMIVIAIALVVAGVLSPSFLFAAVACTAMMGLMMRGTDHGASDQTDRSTAEDVRPER